MTAPEKVISAVMAKLAGYERRPHFATLDADKNIVLHSTVGEWAREFETSDRAVGQTAFDGLPGFKFVASTVFLGIDHSFGEGPQLWFETAVFCNNWRGTDFVRYATWDDAVAGHAATLVRWRWKRYYYPLIAALETTTQWLWRTKWRLRKWVNAKISK